MMRRIVLRRGPHALALAALVLLMALGCARHHTKTRVVHHHGAQVVVIERGHNHSKKCGHYRHGNRWYFVKGHVHGKKCGHLKVKGVWVIQ
ncbi:MAG: hypothetical protein ACE5G2_09785 [Candidatus Krumholzibacteriia bacterium]